MARLSYECRARGMICWGFHPQTPERGRPPRAKGHGLHKSVTVRLLAASARIEHGITSNRTCTFTYHVPENGALLRFPT